MKNNKNINSIITNNNSDLKQKEVITSKSKKMIIEAPAGYGKTFTMVSMIRYWLENHTIPQNKAILCLSFSISAANNMKESISQKLIDDVSNEQKFNIITTNFHGFCRHILKKYGYLVSEDKINELKAVDSSTIDENDKNLNTVKLLEKEIESGNLTIEKLYSKITTYVNAERNFFRPKKQISFDAIIITVINLFINYPNIKYGYQQYISAICIDEFQDTNILGLALIKELKNDKTKLRFFGDQMQQIFSFLGAIPNLIDKILDTYPDFDYVRLNKNYRFSNNKEMLKLDTAIHKFWYNPNDTSIEAVKIQTLHGKNIAEESDLICNLIKEKRKENPKGTFAVLVNQYSYSTQKLISNIEKKEEIIDATFKTNDKKFQNFEILALNLYKKIFTEKCITNNQINNFCNIVSQQTEDSNLKKSFILLLRNFLKSTISGTTIKSRNQQIYDTLNSGTLKNFTSNLSKEITISTIHGAKGLEWDYVIIANFQNGEFPNYYDQKTLNLSNKQSINEAKIEDIKVIFNKLYVAFSRAKKDVFFAYSDKNQTPYGEKNTQISMIKSASIFK